MKATKEQFKEFLAGLGYKQCTDFDEEVMFGDLFGDMWVYFSGPKGDTMNEAYCIMNMAYKGEVDLCQFVRDAMKAKEMQDVTYPEPW